MDCPCFSQNSYEACCKPFHEGALPKTALQLMRSRFSAYAMNLGDYIIATTHLKNPQYHKDHPLWKKSISKFSKETQFVNLTILEATENSVTFVATLMQNGRDASFKEKSLFEKVNERWLYLSGQIT